MYNTGSAATPGYSLTNRVCITNAITVQSVSGPDDTLIVGTGPNCDNAVRGVYMVAGSALTGFTISNGHTRTGGDLQFDRVPLRFRDVGDGVVIAVPAMDAISENVTHTGSSEYVNAEGEVVDIENLGGS